MHRWRKLITLTAVAAIAFANCFAPQFAHAGSPDTTSMGHIEVSGHDHNGASSMPCHDHAADEDQGDDAGTSKYCCASACTASALIFAAPITLKSPTFSVPAAIAVDDCLRAFNAAAVDPPPRTL